MNGKIMLHQCPLPPVIHSNLQQLVVMEVAMLNQIQLKHMHRYQQWTEHNTKTNRQ